MEPSGWPPASDRPWSAIAAMPAHSGVARLVPPICIPRGGRAEVVGVVDGHAGVRVGVGGDVGVGALAVVAGEAVVLLVGGHRERLAVAAAAAVSSRTSAVSTVAVVALRYRLVPPTETTSGEADG